MNGASYLQGLLVGLRDFRSGWTWKSWTFGWVPRVLTNAATWVVLGKLLSSPEKIEFLAIGNMLLCGVIAITWAIAISTWDRAEGTYTLLVISPMGVGMFLLGRTSIWLFNGLATSAIALFGISWMFGVDLPLQNIAVALVVIAVTCISVYAFVFFIGSVISVAPQFRIVASNIVQFAMMAFCGVSVPRSFWSWGIQRLTDVMPLTHGLVALRNVFAGGLSSLTYVELSLEALIGGVWLVLALLFINRLAEVGRRDGSIELT